MPKPSLFFNGVVNGKQTHADVVFGDGGRIDFSLSEKPVGGRITSILYMQVLPNNTVHMEEYFSVPGPEGTLQNGMQKTAVHYGIANKTRAKIDELVRDGSIAEDIEVLRGLIKYAKLRLPREPQCLLRIPNKSLPCRDLALR